MIPFAQLSAECAPMVASSTIAAIVQVESGDRPLEMWNNTTRSMVGPANRAQAIQYLRQAMAAGQQVDVGLAQVDTENFSALGLTPRTAFNACANLRAGATILHADWEKALAHGYRGQVALYHAFEAYNSGRLWGDAGYANKILGAAGAHAPAGYGGLRFASEVKPDSEAQGATLMQFRWQAKPAPVTTHTPSNVAGSWPVLP